MIFVVLCFGACGSAECLYFFKTFFKVMVFFRMSSSEFDTLRHFCLCLDFFKLSGTGNNNILCRLEKEPLAKLEALSAGLHISHHREEANEMGVSEWKEKLKMPKVAIFFF